MSLRLLASVVLLTVATTATAQTSTQIDCNRNPTMCEIEVGGQKLSIGMPKDRVLGLLSKSSTISENSAWSAEHKPDSMYYVTDSRNVIIGGVKFKAEKFDGAMVSWFPASNEGTDLAASLINLLERFSREGSTHCTLTTARSAHPQQEERDATFHCGMRSVSIEHTRFQLLFKGQKVPDQVEIFEMFGNW